MSTSIHPYAPPQVTLDATPNSGARPWMRHPMARAAVLPWVAGVVGLSAMSLAGDELAMRAHLPTVLLGLATLLAAAGVCFAIRAIFVFAKVDLEAHAVGVVGSLVLAGLNGVLTFGMFVLTMWSTSDFRRGRQLRSFGRVLLPRMTPGNDWAALDLGALPVEARVTAPQWRENGRTEHASVAAFAALTQDLMALGAPPALVASANRDALDEIRHTELCFSLARALDGQAASPGPFPEAHRSRPLPLGRTVALTRLACDSLVDGALHEGVSARVLAKLARRCEVPAVKAMLKEIARDEGRHAAHGWDVVEWCVAEGGQPVIDGLVAALRALPETLLSPLPAGAADGGWERFGIHGHALEAAEYAAALAELRRRVGVVKAPAGREFVAEAC